MARRNKLIKFAEISGFSHVYECFDPKHPKLTHRHGIKAEMQGCWNAKQFKNNGPIILELACGRGEYSLALAKTHPENNYIGLDIKGARIWKGAKNALEMNLPNVAFLRTKIEVIEHFFGPEEVSEIWITFPDPFLRKSKANKRLTSIPFLQRYIKIIKDGGIIHLKTDDPTLYEFSKETFSQFPHTDIIYDNDDIYASPLDFPELGHMTYYEKMHLANDKKIKYLRVIITK